MVIWVIGLSGSCKTTFAERVVSQARKRGRAVALLDGDQVREFFGNDLGHGLDDRRKNTDRICRLCSFLGSQEIDVVCATQSLFVDIREWCRQNFSSYYEIFIDTPLDQLIARDSKGIYGQFQRGKIRNVAGLDIGFPRPISPNLSISNTGSQQAPPEQAEHVVDILSAQ